jgi:hypothetical protein
VVVRATAAATAFTFFARTAPYENERYRQNNGYGKKLLPIHDANITAKPVGANGIL